MAIKAILLFACIAVALASVAEQLIPTERVTDIYAVEIPAHHEIDVEDLARAHGMEHVRKIDHHRHVFLFRDIEGDATMTKKLQDHEHVHWMERQVERRRFKRDVIATPLNDPLYGSSWHLHGHPDVDMNVEEAWAMGFTGVGSHVCIVDDGISWQHPDFEGKFSEEGSLDVNYNDKDISPFHWDVHGTASAGVATANANNNVCTTGVAPGATISGVRLLARDTTDAQEAEGITYRGDINQIYSNSWGPNDDGKRLEGPGRLLLTAFENAIDTGRDGLGSIFVWAGGNGREVGDNCNYDGYANSRFTISIGAHMLNGKQAYYSESCAALIATAPSSDKLGNQILSSGIGNACYSHFGGTSASSPAVAGIVALLLEANPDLTWRDVQGVLIDSAKVIDQTDSDWIQNGAGRWVSHKYGYGRIDAAAVVQTGLGWTPLPEYTNTSVMMADIAPIADRSSVSIHYDIDENIIVEHVEIEILVFHPRRGELHIELISPAGTVSVLQETHADYSADIRWKFTSMRLWGEESVGQWTLIISDTITGSSGSFRRGNLSIYGHADV